MLAVHGVIRWALLALLLIVIVKSIIGWLGNKPYTNGDDKINLVAFIFSHIQLLLGLVLLVQLIGTVDDFGAAMKEDAIRLRLMEHPMAMIIGIGLITYGRISAKKLADGVQKHKRVALTFLIGTILIVMRIPAW